MSNKQKSSRRYTKYFSDLSKTAAWTALSYPARLLYLELQRQFIETANNNGKVFLSTRDAAERLGASQRWVCIWYRELEHYGFIVQTQPGTIGPNGRAALWRLTDHAHGWLDGKPIQATKDYLKWDGTPFRKSATKKRKPNGTSVQIATESTHYDDQKYSYASTKSTHRDPQKSEISYDDQKYSYLETSPYSAPAERGVEAEAKAEAAPFGIGHNAGPPMNSPVDLPEMVDDWRNADARAACAGCRPAEIDWPVAAAASLDIPTFLLRGHPDCIGHNAGPPLNSPVDDDLVIPAFLRRHCRGLG